MDKQKAAKELAEIVENAKQNHQRELEKAKALADQFGLTFVWNDTYGSQEQEYLGKGSEKDKFNYNTRQYEKVEVTQGEWVSSSDNC